jgi:spore maturation protein CgeB
LPRIVFVKSRYDYGDRSRGFSYEENNFLHTLVASGHEVLAFDPLDARSKIGKTKMNRALLESVFRFAPDIVFFVLFSDEISSATLLEIKDNMKIPTINWFTDDHWRFDEFSSKYAPFFSYAVTTHKRALTKYAQSGIQNVIYSQWACNHFLYRKLDLPYIYDVSFVGQPHGDRQEVIKRIRKAGVNVETFGFGWPRGRVTTYEMVKILNQTRVNLNLSNDSRGQTNQIKGRDFEIPGCGAFMITGPAEDIEQYYVMNDEIVSYRDVTDLIEKVRYYLAHEDERERIKNKGYQRVIAEHTYVSRFNAIFGQALEQLSN